MRHLAVLFFLAVVIVALALPSPPALADTDTTYYVLDSGPPVAVALPAMLPPPTLSPPGEYPARGERACGSSCVATLDSVKVRLVLEPTEGRGHTPISGGWRPLAFRCDFDALF